MIWSLFFWFLDNWLIIPWLVGIVVAYIYGGRNMALIVGTLGLGAFMFNAGKKDERSKYNDRASKLEKDRENAYDEIDNRDTNRDDVIERLRKNNY